MKYKDIHVGDILIDGELQMLCLSKSREEEHLQHNCKGDCNNCIGRGEKGDPNICLDLSDHEIVCTDEESYPTLRKATDSELLLIVIKSKNEWVRERIKKLLRRGG